MLPRRRVKRLLAHLVGDYILQTHYEAVAKTNSWLPAATHAAKYTAAFLPVTRSPKALAVIGGTHMIIDRFRLTKRISWAVNQLAPVEYRSTKLDNCGYPKSTPQGLAIALMIIVDNTTHMLINEWALDKWEDNG